MVKLPEALSIALWLGLFLWALRIISYIFELPVGFFWLAVLERASAGQLSSAA